MELTVVGGSRESRPGRARHTGAGSRGRGPAASGRKVRATIGVFATMYDHNSATRLGQTWNDLAKMVQGTTFARVARELGCEHCQLFTTAFAASFGLAIARGELSLTAMETQGEVGPLDMEVVAVANRGRRRKERSGQSTSRRWSRPPAPCAPTSTW
jgi:hypothetical protein